MNTIAFEKIINARDLGGLKTADGRTVRSGLLLRTATLSDASDADVRLLREKYRLRRIFDFRTMEEQSRQPDRYIPGAEYILLPTLDVEAERRSGDAIPSEFFARMERHIVGMAFNASVKKKARELYPSLIRSEYSQLQYATFLNLVLQTTEGAVLWHCSQGKDRTGIGAALLLGALGADRSTIVSDFDGSNVEYRPLVEHFQEEIRRRGGGAEELDVVQAFLGVHTGNFCATLDEIDRTWGSLHNYIVSCIGLTGEDILFLRNRYLE